MMMPLALSQAIRNDENGVKRCSIHFNDDQVTRLAIPTPNSYHALIHAFITQISTWQENLTVKNNIAALSIDLIV